MNKLATKSIINHQPIIFNSNNTPAPYLKLMTHELRTPLNAIIGLSEMLLEDAQAHHSEALTRIHQAGKNLLEVINNIIELAKLETGNVDIHNEDIPINSLLMDLHQQILPLAKKNHNQFKIPYKDNKEKVCTDYSKLKKALFQILVNACKFTKNGFISLQATHNTTKKCIEFQIKDTGIGMSPETLAQIFDCYYQHDNFVTREYDGLGIGLAIAKRMVESMHGEISVQSRQGKGSTFIVKIPC